MSLRFAVTRPEESAALMSFLSGVFNNASALPTLQPDALRWKYFDPHPWWPEGRSYTLQTPDAIAAHGCVSPVRFEREGAPVESMQIVDWAAVRIVPAAGLLIYRHCLERSKGTLLTVGGSADTLAIIPQVKWFRRKNGLGRYARPLRAWRHFAAAPHKSGRDAARFLRNLKWQWTPGLPPSHGWRCRPARPDDRPAEPRGDFIPIVRTRAWFEYLLHCPVVNTSFLILEGGGRRGHAFLAHVRGSVLVADCAIDGESSDDERAGAFAAVVRHVAASPDAAEIVAASSLPGWRAAFERCGLRSRGDVPVYLADPRRQLPDDATLEINLLVGESFYLHDPAYPFLC